VIARLWQKVARRLARAYERRQMKQAARQPDELAGQVAQAHAILFVCTGNIIRSAFAAELLRSRSLGWGDGRIRSAGLFATAGPAHPTAVECARRFGVDLSPHRTHRLDCSDIEGVDVVFAMEIDHVVEINRRFPQHRHKVYLFGCLDDDAQDVADPVYAPKDVFERASNGSTTGCGGWSRCSLEHPDHQCQPARPDSGKEYPGPSAHRVFARADWKVSGDAPERFAREDNRPPHRGIWAPRPRDTF
jgi:protein-tyrosine-phosphatase